MTQDFNRALREDGQLDAGMPRLNLLGHERRHREADGMTPTERCPVSVPDEFRSVAISCWSDVQLSRIAWPT